MSYEIDGKLITDSVVEGLKWLRVGDLCDWCGHDADSAIVALGRRYPSCPTHRNIVRDVAIASTGTRARAQREHA